MKKSLLFILAIMLSVFCTGCVKYSYNIEIDDNDNVAFSKTEALNSSFFQNSVTDFQQKFDLSIKQHKDSFSQDGYEVEEYLDNGYKGIIASKKNLSLKEASDTLANEFGGDEDIFSMEKKGFSKIYKVHFVYDFKTAMDQATKDEQAFLTSQGYNDMLVENNEQIDVVSNIGETSEQSVDSNETIQDFDSSDSESLSNSQNQQIYDENSEETNKTVKSPKPISELTIKIPEKAVKNNATKVVSDTEYYWDLAGAKQPVEIILEYRKFDFSSLGPIFSVLVVFGILCYLIYKSKSQG